MSDAVSPAAPPPAASPRRGWLGMSVKATLGGIVAALLLGAGALPWWLSQPERLSRIVAAALPELQADLRFEAVKLGWSGPLVLDGVTVAPRNGGRPPITIGRIEGSHGLLAMLFSAGDLGRLSIDGLAVDVAFDEHHATNLEGLVRPKAGAAADPPRRPTRAAVRLRLEIEDAIVRITGPWTTEPWVSEPVDLKASLAPVAAGWSEWTVEPVRLLTDARMDPPVAWGVLAYIAPVLADATRTSGRFSLELDGARLPVGDPAGGSLSGTLAMHEVVVGPGPLVTDLFRKLPGNLPAPPSIRVADESRVRFALADRRVRHEGLEFGVPLPGEGRRLDVQSSGTVGLDDRALDLKLVLPIPGDIRQDRPLLAALAGKTISLGVAGQLGAPEVVFDGSIGRMASDVARELLDRARGGGVAAPGSSPPEVQTPPPAIDGEAVVDIVGGVIEEIARRRAARQAAEAAGEVPPRGGRLRGRTPPPQPAPVDPDGR